jgi:hypothetical protein
MWKNIRSYFLKKIDVVIITKEDCLPIITSIINVVKLIFVELHIS